MEQSASPEVKISHGYKILLILGQTALTQKAVNRGYPGPDGPSSNPRTLLLQDTSQHYSPLQAYF